MTWKLHCTSIFHEEGGVSIRIFHLFYRIDWIFTQRHLRISSTFLLWNWFIIPFHIVQISVDRNLKVGAQTRPSVHLDPRKVNKNRSKNSSAWKKILSIKICFYHFCSGSHGLIEFSIAYDEPSQDLLINVIKAKVSL